MSLSVSSIVFGFVVDTSTMESASESNTSSSPPSPSSPMSGVSFNFVGSSAVDYVRFRPTTGNWEIKDGATGATSDFTLGTSSSQLVPGDYDGDGKTDAAVYAAGVWTIRQSTTGTTVTASHGSSGDKPVGGDCDGDDRDNLCDGNSS